MYTGIAVFLMAVGAILAFAVHAHVTGVDVNAIGLILLAAGGFLFLFDLFYWGPRRRRYYSEHRNYEDY